MQAISISHISLVPHYNIIHIVWNTLHTSPDGQKYQFELHNNIVLHLFKYPH